MDLINLAEGIFLMLGVAHLCATILLSIDTVRPGPSRMWTVCGAPTLCFGVAAGAAAVSGYSTTTVIAIAVIAAVGMTVMASIFAVKFHPAGVVSWITLSAATAVGIPVGFAHLFGNSVDPFSRVLLWILAVVGVLRTPSGLMQLFENWEVTLRRRWDRSLEPMTNWVPPGKPPMVTIQVPIHAEPAEMVIQTLDCLARLDYPDYEVLVIDNNTSREDLWRPVEAHCAELGPRFRFLHVEGIRGAKAGALNFLRAHLDSRTELIGLVDADYQVEPDWLAHTVGFFDDPEIGFVQCPHAYREFEHSAYGRMVNSGYEWAQRTEMVSRNEHGAGITIGTMSLIRLEAIDIAGGWSEWCQTEDSEFAIRAHAVGYNSIFLNKSYGRGLIPETFGELKKQRFRWTYGPGQEFKTHFRLYFPFPSRVPSALSWSQRLRHAHYGLVVLTTGLGSITLPAYVAILLMAFIFRSPPDVTIDFLIPVGVLIVSRRIMRWTIFATAVGADFRQTIGACIALLAVKPTITTAALSVLIGKPTSWQRTNKFRSAPEKYRYIRDARHETVLALACTIAAGLALFMLPTGLASVVLALGFVWQAIVYGCALLLAYSAEFAVRNASIQSESMECY